MVEFQPYTASETSLPKSGYYYLTKDITTSASSGINPGETLALDLNGHTVTFKARGFSFISSDASSKLYLSDSVGTGKYLIKNGTPNQGNGIWLPKGSATMFGVTFDATGIAAEGHYGGVICLEGGNATFTMTGGLVTGGIAGGSAEKESANFQSCGQSANTWIKLSGGEIAGCMTLNRLAAPETQAFITVSGSARITGTGVGLNLASNVTAQTFQIGALTENALIRIRPQSTNPFAMLSADFTADMAMRFVSTDASKKVAAQAMN